MTASTYTRNNTINALLRGVAFPLPAGTYVSLHTADPGTTGASEVSTAAWPNYVRRNAEQGGAIGTGWTASTTGTSSNTKQLPFPNMNGGTPITVTHFAVWDALSGGNCLESGPLNITRILGTGDIFIADVGALVTSMT